MLAFPEQELVFDDALLPRGAPREPDARLGLGLGPEVHGLARHWVGVGRGAEVGGSRGADGVSSPLGVPIPLERAP